MKTTWSTILETEKQKPYFTDLLNFIQQERQNGKTVYPSSEDVFNALEYTPLEKVKVVILGQDPYHGPNQAHGLCFSVQKGVKTPPSLTNIYKEIKNDLGHPIPSHGNLTTWAKQGVFLLNTVLTVEESLAHSHKNKGWEKFTDTLIQKISDACPHIVFLLWGAPAQKKEKLINTEKHTILKAPHPSPLSAHRGFFGCNHFSLANAALKDHKQEPIDWQIT